MSTRTVRLIRYGAAIALSLFTLAGMAGLPGAAAQEDPRAKEIREVEKKLEELKARLAALKGQQTAKGGQKPLTLKDALAWKSITRAALTRDGRWFACAVMPAEGKGEVVLKEVAGGGERRFPVGESMGGLTFSHDSRWLAFSSAPKGKGGAGRRASPAASAPGGEAPPQAKLVLVNVGSGDKVEYDGVTRFSFSGESGAALAVYQPPAAPAPTMPAGLTTGRGPAATPEQPAQPPRARGGSLILRDLASGKELTLGNVADFAFDKKGQRLALTIDAPGQLGNGVQLRDMKTGVLTQLDSGKAGYERLAWTEKGDGFALLKTSENKGYKDKRCAVLVCTDVSAAAPALTAYDPSTDAAFPKGMVISTSQAPRLSEDLGTVFFGIREPRKDDAAQGKGRGFDKKLDPTKGGGEALAKGAAEKPDLVIWHGKDARLQAQQQVEAGRDQEYSYVCACHLKDRKFVRLADDALRDVTVGPKQRYAVGIDRRAYERSGSLDGRRHQDVYVIDLRTGERHLAMKKKLYPVPGMLPGSISPDGAKLLYYDDGQYHVYDMAERKSRCITKDAPTSFVNAEDDHNVDRPPTRALGWAKDGSAVLLSDNWDVWKVPAGGGPAVNLTSNGKKDAIRYQTRLALDPEEKGIDLEKPLYLVALGEWTKKSGYVRIDPKGPPAVLCWDDAAVGSNTVPTPFGPATVMKAPEADVFVFTRETVSDFPDYHATDSSFKSPRRLTNANPEQAKYAWSSGSVLVDYESAKGDRLQGALYLPANYEKGKKYPTVVYIYERLSQNKNRYLRPGVGGGGFNPAIYTSNGYAVFTPDIKYRVNDPGLSAVWCVLPALEAAVATGVVDRDRVGLHGHSWGGYQTAFLITQTPAFKAAVAGAPLTNLVSMYSSVYWNTGSANQPIFESSQGRFTGGYWEQLEAYMRNSPVFHAKNVTTPLLLLHNDKDGAVDFNQGIEYFNTLRRLDKPVVMLQYKGENHGLAKPANQKDYARRMREFFDHHLMGKPAPGWLAEGVPHLKMDEHLKERGDGN